MTVASHIFRHSKQLRNVPGLPWQNQAILVRWFPHCTHSITNNGDDMLKYHQINNGFGGNICAYKSSSRPVSNTPMFTRSYRVVNPTKVQNGLAVRAEGASASGMMLSRGISCFDVRLRKSFSTNSGLPPHQELGMPSLSPTMTEGNIARWLKKEGDKVSAGEVLCEVETDKATVEMECMEEGYLAKIIHGDGAKEIKVGEVIAITVEDKDDIEKFSDYRPQILTGAARKLSQQVSLQKKR